MDLALATALDACLETGPGAPLATLRAAQAAREAQGLRYLQVRRADGATDAGTQPLRACLLGALDAEGYAGSAVAVWVDEYEGAAGTGYDVSALVRAGSGGPLYYRRYAEGAEAAHREQAWDEADAEDWPEAPSLLGGGASEGFASPEGSTPPAGDAGRLRLHVVPNSGGTKMERWALTEERIAGPLSLHATQAEAVEAGRAIGLERAAQGLTTSVYVHGADGKVRGESSYGPPGSDPVASAG